jgi:hypothetical protein
VAKAAQSPSSTSLSILLDSPASTAAPAITAHSRPVAAPKMRHVPGPIAPKPSSQPGTRVVMSQPQHDEVLSSPRRQQIANAARQNLARPPVSNYGMFRVERELTYASIARDTATVL